ncbi:hypothetical protein AB0M79_24050 [Polymorphospora sp. NPDC051019]|uniref:hypothetical protein n=1 Tax=Polymorphospora sp. NPDC051019 TaxID=3155725 RepID=UPI0034299DC0
MRARVASGVAVVVRASAALIVLGRAGLGPPAVPAVVAAYGVRVLFGLLLLEAVLKAASSSRWERWFRASYALVLAGLCFVAARAGGG